MIIAKFASSVHLFWHGVQKLVKVLESHSELVDAETLHV